MTAVYVPILKAKAGELAALMHLKDVAVEQIIPWFDISPINDEKLEKLNGQLFPPVESYLSGVAAEISTVWKSRKIFLDMPKWATNAQTEGGEHVIPFLRNQLASFRVSADLVVDYVRWDDPVYANALRGARVTGDCNFALRLVMDSDTVEELSEEEFFLERLADISDTLDFDPALVMVMIDFGDISNEKHTMPDLVSKSERAIDILKKAGFKIFRLAGCSLPAFISQSIKKQNSTGLVVRKEMGAWRTLIVQPGLELLGFSDYGIRGPNAKETGGASNANGKIRYTIEKEIFIARGYPLTEGLKGAQHQELARLVIKSGSWAGEKFSWGDKEILRCSEGAFSGNSSDWIAIDTNHHIHSVVREVIEYRELVAAKAARQPIKV
ncbi:beta family protein [Pseudomonas nunensis]|uniref:Beta family protein n=1 Tax=Pseudomonas nunensis TaxID=2961896 RepID=A0ABY5EJU8_9PSED|nr:beta family protein [Pseudomonas nunensis]KPN87742.1 hypothetical protein AL066_26220 [Pseudomonas nunensis]MCL5227174.1 beta family protein [Pseudomonas nunensis]UTO14587.1 beta family protein [Pseudomonas nunensis]